MCLPDLILKALHALTHEGFEVSALAIEGVEKWLQCQRVEAAVTWEGLVHRTLHSIIVLTSLLTLDVSPSVVY
jgi:hypothetical protein